MMLPQRARVAESRVKNKSSNGPRRVQSNAHERRVFCNVRAYVSCRGCAGIPPSAWGHAHEIRVAPRIKGQVLFVPDRRGFFCRGRFVLYSFGRRAGGVFVFTERGSSHEDTAHAG